MVCIWKLIETLGNWRINNLHWKIYGKSLEMFENLWFSCKVTQRSIGAGDENSRIWSFHLDNLKVPKLVPHLALQPGTEVVDPSKVKLRFPRARGAGIRPSGAGF